MSNLDKLRQEVQTAKAQAFDLYMEAQQLRYSHQQQQHVLFMMAHILGVGDMNSLNIEALPAMLSDKLRELNTPAQDDNQKD